MIELHKNTMNKDFTKHVLWQYKSINVLCQVDERRKYPNIKLKVGILFYKNEEFRIYRMSATEHPSLYLLKRLLDYQNL